MGTIILVGGNEFRANCVAMDRAILAKITQRPARVAIVPTAAAFQNPNLAVRNGIQHFDSLGAQTSGVMILNQQDADDLQVLQGLRSADLIYLPGGDPQHLLNTLKGSLAWDVMVDLWHAGAVIAGSSAGAMVLGGRMYYHTEWKDALGLVPRVTVLPHYKVTRVQGEHPWRGALEEELIFGIAESTGILGVTENTWQVVGEGGVAVYSDQEMVVFKSGDRFEIP